MDVLSESSRYRGPMWRYARRLLRPHLNCIGRYVFNDNVDGISIFLLDNPSDKQHRRGAKPDAPSKLADMIRDLEFREFTNITSEDVIHPKTPSAGISAYDVIRIKFTSWLKGKFSGESDPTENDPAFTKEGLKTVRDITRILRDDFLELGFSAKDIRIPKVRIHHMTLKECVYSVFIYFTDSAPSRVTPAKLSSVLKKRLTSSGDFKTVTVSHKSDYEYSITVKFSDSLTSRVVSRIVGDNSVDWRPSETIPEDYYAEGILRKFIVSI